MKPSVKPGTTKPAPMLAKALIQSEQVKTKVEECAEELSLVNTVLKVELDEQMGTGEIQEALHQSELIEEKVQECADDLHAINAALAQEVGERKRLEQKLSDSKAQEERARYLAYHDITTGLANRALFNERLDHALMQAERHNWSLAIMYMDLDKFKTINDTHGHHVGDKVLQLVGERLQACVRGEDTISRIGGDEFLCLLIEVKNDITVAKIAELMIKKVSEPCQINQIKLVIQPSIGIALYPRDGTTADALLKTADAAMYRAKQGEENYCFYSRADH